MRAYAGILLFVLVFATMAAVPVSTAFADTAPGQAKAPGAISTASDKDVRVIEVQNLPGNLTERFGRVTGTVTYRERRALTPNAVFIVRLVEPGRTNQRTQVLSEQRIMNPGQVPIPFVLWYNRDSINNQSRYAVEVQISEGGSVLWRNSTQYLVITQGRPTNVNVVLSFVSTPGGGGGVGPPAAGLPRIVVGGVPIAFEAGRQPYRVGGTWMLPVRTMLDAADVGFTYTGGVLRVADDGVRLSVPVPGRRVTFSDGTRRTLTTNVVVRNGVLYAPVQFIEMATGTEARYNRDTNTYTFVED